MSNVNGEENKAKQILAEPSILYQHPDTIPQELRVSQPTTCKPATRATAGEGCYSKTLSITISRCATFGPGTSTSTHGCGSALLRTLGARSGELHDHCGKEQFAISGEAWLVGDKHWKGLSLDIANPVRCLGFDQVLGAV